MDGQARVILRDYHNKSEKKKDIINIKITKPLSYIIDEYFLLFLNLTNDLNMYKKDSLESKKNSLIIIKADKINFLIMSFFT